MIPWLALAAGAGSVSVATYAIINGTWMAAIPALAALPAGLMTCFLATKRTGLQSGLHAVDDINLLEFRANSVSEDLQRLTDEQDLQRGVFEVSTELVGCVDELDARARFSAALSRWWSYHHLALLVWSKGTWRSIGSEPAGSPPELIQGVQLPSAGHPDLILDLSAGVDGQAAIILRGAQPQPSLHGLSEVVQQRIADVLRSQLALSLRRVLLYQDLQELARTDPLTTVHRRWYGEQRLEELVESGAVVAVAMIDIDHFKSINDTHGHAAGDAVLTAVGKAITATIRLGDVACRYGGEEFLVILPSITNQGAQLAGERLRAAIEAISDMPAQVTVSIGIACVHIDEAALELVTRADRSLYEAKNNGRNRVVDAEIQVPPSSIRTTGRLRRISGRNPTP